MVPVEWARSPIGVGRFGVVGGDGADAEDVLLLPALLDRVLSVKTVVTVASEGAPMVTLFKAGWEWSKLCRGGLLGTWLEVV